MGCKIKIKTKPKKKKEKKKKIWVVFLSCKSPLSYLDTSPLSDIKFANTFSHSVVVFSRFWWFPWKHQSFDFFLINLIFMKFRWSIFWLFAHTFGLYLRILCQTQINEDLPLFSSKSLIVLVFTFRSLIHLELIFIYGIRKGFYFIILHVTILLSQNLCWKDLSFPSWMVLALLLKISGPQT